MKKIEVQILHDLEAASSVLAARFGKNFCLKSSFNPARGEDVALAVRLLLESVIENHAAIRDALATE